MRAAMESVPGVVFCALDLTSTEAPEEGAREYVVEIQSAQRRFGWVVLQLGSGQEFAPYEAAIHNFSNAMAIRLENLDYQNHLERRVEEQTAELEQSRAYLAKTVEEKNLLLREVHHRVKNNLNLVISVIRLQFQGFEESAVRRAVDATVARIHSMSVVHEFLHQSETQPVINIKQFLERLVEELSTSYLIGDRVTVQQDIKAVTIPTELAVPVSLMVNELLTNSLKYAFPDGRRGSVRVGLCETEGEVELSVQDNGIGLPAGFSLETRDSLGMQLVHALTEQLGGTLSFERGAAAPAGEGARFVIRFPAN